MYDEWVPIATVPLPGIARILEIGRDRILALATGPYDVEMVRAYRYGPR